MAWAPFTKRGDKERHTRVALKSLVGLDPLSLRLFKNEFRALADLSHPNLATLFELFSEEGRWFFSMEYIEGVHFLDYVRPKLPGVPPHAPLEAILGPDEPTLPLHRVVPGHCDMERLQSSLEQFTQAVLALHNGGILHRDLKPLNVKVTPEGRLVVLDFGLAAHARPVPFDDQATFSGRVGTISYMSPEQALGDPVTEATDWYSVGVMIYEALTGRRPFEGTSRQILESKTRVDAPPLRMAWESEDVREAATTWSRICAGLLERDPARRMPGTDLLTLAPPRTCPRGAPLPGRACPQPGFRGPRD